MKKAYPLLTATALALAMLPALQGCFPLVAAGVGTGVVATLDRRTYGTQVEDKEIELRLSRQVSDKYGKRARVETTSYNRWVLLTGVVESTALRAEVEQLAREQRNVRQVINELVVGAPQGSFVNYSSDAATSTKVKGRLLDRPTVANNVKVLTESGTVYLMGILTAYEAGIATETARTTNGVMKVVQAIEVISEEEARRLDPQRQQQSAPAAQP